MFSYPWSEWTEMAPPEGTGHKRTRWPVAPRDVLQTPAYATYAEEGRTGGISLITTSYPR